MADHFKSAVGCANCGQVLRMSVAAFCSDECRSERLAIMDDGGGLCTICGVGHHGWVLEGIWQGMLIQVCSDPCLHDLLGRMKEVSRVWVEGGK